MIWIIAAHKAVYATAVWVEQRDNVFPMQWELWARTVDGGAWCVGKYSTLADAQDALAGVFSTIRDQGCFVDLRKA